MSSEKPFFLHKAWLNKKSKYLGFWRNRFAVLTTSTFSTYESEDINSVPTERIPIKNILSVQSENVDPEHPFGFKITTDSQVFLFFVESEEEKAKWLGILSWLIRQTVDIIEENIQ